MTQLLQISQNFLRRRVVYQSRSYGYRFSNLLKYNFISAAKTSFSTYNYMLQKSTITHKFLQNAFPFSFDSKALFLPIIFKDSVRVVYEPIVFRSQSMISPEVMLETEGLQLHYKWYRNSCFIHWLQAIFHRLSS